MKAHWERGLFRLWRADSFRLLPHLPENSVDAVVTDPPSSISFMGKPWDCDKGGREQWTSWLAGVMGECLRCLKPGGYGLVWAIPRRSHWTAIALEDAGFEIRDRIAHLFGSGFPKGKGCLKPACEDWWLVRKPSKKVLPLGIDACRVSTDCLRPSRERRQDDALDATRNTYGTGINGSRAVDDTALGRWPANIVHDGSEEVLDLFAKYGETVSTGGKNRNGFSKDPGWDRPSHANWGPSASQGGLGDSGSVARFFYCAKADKQDRDEGLKDFETVTRCNGNKWTDQDYRVANGERTAGRESKPRRNTHPTVKPCSLMRWLCKLVCPPNGTILDPFLGSGSTGKAAAIEGFGFLGIEREPEYFAIACARIDDAITNAATLFDPAPQPTKTVVDPQPSLFTPEPTPE